MPYFDPSTMRLPQSPSAVESIGSGLKLKEMFQQQQQYQRQQGFMQAIGEIVQSGVDYKTPEGQQKLVQGLAAKGYGAEAFDLAQRLPQPKGQSWKNIPGTGTIFEEGSGTTKETGVSPYQKPLIPPDPLQKEKLGLAKEKFEEQKRMNEAKRKQMGVKPVAPQTPEKGLSAEAAKTLSVSATLFDDIQEMKSAFTKDFTGTIAGIKTGTNPRLSILADQIADKIGRLRSGGAVNPAEEARFKRAIASIKSGVFATPQEAIEALDWLAKEAQFVAEGMDPGAKVRERIKASNAPTKAADPRSITKPEEEEEYQAWKKAQGH